MTQSRLQDYKYYPRWTCYITKIRDKFWNYDRYKGMKIRDPIHKEQKINQNHKHEILKLLPVNYIRIKIHIIWVKCKHV